MVAFCKHFIISSSRFWKKYSPPIFQKYFYYYLIYYSHLYHLSIEKKNYQTRPLIYSYLSFIPQNLKTSQSIILFFEDFLFMSLSLARFIQYCFDQDYIVTYSWQNLSKNPLNSCYFILQIAIFTKKTLLIDAYQYYSLLLTFFNSIFS